MACATCNSDTSDCPCRFEVPCGWCGQDDDARTMHSIGRRFMCERCRDYFGAKAVTALAEKHHPIVH